ncbi:MAG: diguanylate cyclase (GGDEF)-like protein [Lentisphaeria bacterium]|jgi:diguanylate cyclase (GGDEF)-like protein
MLALEGGNYMNKDDLGADGLMDFVSESSGGDQPERETLVWRVLIIDDEKDVHSATTFALRSTEVIGRPLEFLHANSSREAKAILLEKTDIAVILLDVVMETPNAGLDLVAVIRNELHIKDTRIILRTGQPNQAPEIEVIRDYDINDYKLKSELTQSRLFASLTTAIRSYKQIQTIEAGRCSLSMIVKSSAELLTKKGINEFAQGVILHLSGLLSIVPEGLICVPRRGLNLNEDSTHIIAAAGHYTKLIDRPLNELDEKGAKEALLECLDKKCNVFKKDGIALYLGSQERGDMACFVTDDVSLEEVDKALIELFCSNISICADNLQLVSRLSDFAYHDVLIGLPNRNSLVEHMDKVLGREGLEKYALSMVDIDNFAEINASLGQDYGDELLIAVGRRMENFFPSPSFVARVAGDTFAVFGPSEEIDSKRLLAPFLEPFNAGSEEQIISVTAGIVPLSETKRGADEAVKDASIVLKMAKNHNRGEVVLFRQNMVTDA